MSTELTAAPEYDPLAELYVDWAASSNPDAYKTEIAQLAAAHENRTKRPFAFLDSRVSHPQLPEDGTVLERVWELEATHFNPRGDKHGYRNGSATTPNQTIKVLGMPGRTLMTGEHATVMRRDGNWKEQDDFVGAYALLAAEFFGTSALATIGMQEGDPNWDLEHPFKEEMREILLGMECGHVALHGCARLTEDLSNPRPLDLQLGIGSNPSQATIEAAERMVAAARVLDLRAGINVPFWKIAAQPVPHLERDENGVPKTNRFAAAMPRTTRSFAESVIGANKPAIQIEIASTLRPQLPDTKMRKSSNQEREAANRLATFLGDIVEITRLRND